ncbi:MAG: hypothetical protein A3K19_18185 [Lentisphaerae bacterium RIFOXYB12_FULL_65_16]|nr:MAG: hypothetical protein A3K18_09670 [Lentisphaerae bacterium RIFOXYA12_64_32]OGV90211.1 MAG: hypothetical protein A3K19_18185 [Lentisphaerae bacterium RIFOXYB12_FULL_65_16]
MLELDHFRLENDTTVFIDNLSVKLGPGQSLGVVGPTQSGKTFLLTTLGGRRNCTPAKARAPGFFRRWRLNRGTPAAVRDLVEKHFGVPLPHVLSDAGASRGQSQLRSVLAYLLGLKADVAYLDTPFLNLDVVTLRQVRAFIPEFLRLTGKCAVITSTDDDLDFATVTVRLQPHPKERTSA